MKVINRYKVHSTTTERLVQDTHGIYDYDYYVLFNNIYNSEK